MYFKTIEDNYIVSVGTTGNTEITKAEYDHILNVIKSCPVAPEGYGYKLKTDLTWEKYELPPEPEPQPSQEWYDGYDQAILDMMEEGE